MEGPAPPKRARSSALPASTQAWVQAPTPAPAQTQLLPQPAPAQQVQAPAPVQALAAQVPAQVPALDSQDYYIHYFQPDRHNFHDRWAVPTGGDMGDDGDSPDCGSAPAADHDDPEEEEGELPVVDRDIELVCDTCSLLGCRNTTAWYNPSSCESGPEWCEVCAAQRLGHDDYYS